MNIATTAVGGPGGFGGPVGGAVAAMAAEGPGPGLGGAGLGAVGVGGGPALGDHIQIFGYQEEMKALPTKAESTRINLSYTITRKTPLANR
ncbi:hypothetical protein AVEN_138641-1 [Araneus ventricosus]|uniref:Uncharacterized protein n=1 Tax=Araneus ventricosus TaxID=182803 RepID=A0A4Y2E507_ARAVE|nr:hypothetical protein AVEN_138641-1 [Araneus ventricosus]